MAANRVIECSSAFTVPSIESGLLFAAQHTFSTAQHAP